jgi:nucleoside-diphosphate-sugar epimerase
MAKDKVLVIGASGQIGVELTLALRKIYGNAHVVASDLREENELLKGTGPYVSLDVMNKEMLHVQVIRQNITQIYLLAAILSATGEKNPNLAWHLNMQGLLNVLDIAREEKLQKVYWPSSIAVFGPTSPKKNCPQRTIIEPSTVYGISKYAGEFWCNYFFERYGVDVRSIRYPGLISYKSDPGGGTTDYAV